MIHLLDGFQSTIKENIFQIFSKRLLNGLDFFHNSNQHPDDHILIPFISKLFIQIKYINCSQKERKKKKKKKKN